MRTKFAGVKVKLLFVECTDSAEQQKQQWHQLNLYIFVSPQCRPFVNMYIARAAPYRRDSGSFCCDNCRGSHIVQCFPNQCCCKHRTRAACILHICIMYTYKSKKMRRIGLIYNRIILIHVFIYIYCAHSRSHWFIYWWIVYRYKHECLRRDACLGRCRWRLLKPKRRVYE